MTPRSVCFGVLTLSWIVAVCLADRVGVVQAGLQRRARRVLAQARRRWTRARLKHRIPRLRRLPCRVCPCRTRKRPPSPAPRYDETYWSGVERTNQL